MYHYDDVIMTTIAFQITSLTSVNSTVYSDADQRKHQSTASLAFVWGIHRDRWIPRTKGQLRGKCFHLMTSSCVTSTHLPLYKLTAISIFKCIFMNGKFCILIRISLKFAPKVPLNNILALVQIMACPGERPLLSEPMLAQFTDAYMRHQGRWVNFLSLLALLTQQIFSVNDIES